MVLGREGGVDLRALVAPDEGRGGLDLEDVRGPAAEGVADPCNGGERGRRPVALELADEALRQPGGRCELLDREPALAAERADARADLRRVVAGSEGRSSRHEPIIRRFSPAATAARAGIPLHFL